MRDEQQKINIVNGALLKIKRGDEEGVNELYREISHTLRYIALKYLQNDEEADDLVQDFWADIFHIAAKASYIYNGFAYLCKVMNRRAITRYKKINGSKEVIGYVDYASIDSASADFSDETDLRITVESAMNLLDEQEKIVIQETYFEGKNIRQIAMDIGLSKSKVGRLKLSALKKMQNFLDESGTKSSDGRL